ncbi:MAG TPA: serine hydrolase, partial [Chitinophagaceae bacterium]|nr:serine hydrolase [Chitinophagaceae bacterium]
IIVESVTHQFFPNYIKENIFKPIGMQNSFVFNINDTSNYVPSYQFNNIPYTLESFDCVYGDKNVYSTVRDLWLLDKALYNNSIISKNTFNIATTAYSNETKGNKNYGLGWRLFLKNNDTVIYHGGWWHGNNSLFTRLIKDTATVITLGNRYNKRIYNSKQMATIFSNKEIGEVEE